MGPGAGVHVHDLAIEGEEHLHRQDAVAIGAGNAQGNHHGLASGGLRVRQREAREAFLRGQAGARGGHVQ